MTTKNQKPEAPTHDEQSGLAPATCYTAGTRVIIHLPAIYSGQTGTVIYREESLRQVMVKLDASEHEPVFHMTEIQAV